MFFRSVMNTDSCFSGYTCESFTINTNHHHMNIKQILDLIIIVLGTVSLILAGYIFIWGEIQVFSNTVNRLQAIVPAVLGSLFLGMESS